MQNMRNGGIDGYEREQVDEDRRRDGRATRSSSINKAVEDVVCSMTVTAVEPVAPMPVDEQINRYEGTEA
ncbi:hypothetical protein COOONC_21763 [Cooperia oncophora]